MKTGHFNVLLWLMFGFGILSSIMTASTLNLDPSRPDSNATCYTRQNKTGRCIPLSLCDDEHNFIEGGNLIDNDLRSKKQCPEGEWCCTLNTTNPVKATEKPILTKNVDEECLTTKMDSCPWCVGLYKTKGVKPGNSGLFCGGILVGPNAVLTTATCMKAAKHHQIIHAKVPGSQDPEKTYLVRSRAEHEQYNTGSHEYDVAVFMLETDVVWNNGRNNNGACLNIKWPLDNACYAFGFNYNDEIESTILETKKGSCTKGGQGADAACGSLIFKENNCLVSPGLPVICMTNNKDFIVAGLARSPCRNSKAQLGSIHPASDWLIKELSKNGIEKPKEYDVINEGGNCVDKAYCKVQMNETIENSVSCGIYQECGPSNKVITPLSNTTNIQECLSLRQKECPWCVSLFNNDPKQPRRAKL